MEQALLIQLTYLMSIPVIFTDHESPFSLWTSEKPLNCLTEAINPSALERPNVAAVWNGFNFSYIHTKTLLAYSSLSCRKRHLHAEPTSNLWQCCGVQGLRSNNASGHPQRVRLHVASSLIQAILSLATSPLVGLPFTPTLIQSGWTHSAAAEWLKLRLRLWVQWFCHKLITPGYRRGLLNSHQLPCNYLSINSLR